MMKASCTLVASVLAASTAALTSNTSYASEDHSFAVYPPPREVHSSHPRVKTASPNLQEKEKFAPRFDGLRFIETLVTAHR